MKGWIDVIIVLLGKIGPGGYVYSYVSLKSTLPPSHHTHDFVLVLSTVNIKYICQKNKIWPSRFKIARDTIRDSKRFARLEGDLIACGFIFKF